MRALRECGGKELVWEQGDAAASVYDLLVGAGELVATLRRGLGDQAEVQVAGGRWRLAGPGVWGRRITVRPAGAPPAAPPAVFRFAPAGDWRDWLPRGLFRDDQADLGEGAVEAPGHPPLRWAARPAPDLDLSWVWDAPAGAPPVHYTCRRHPWPAPRLRGRIVVEPSAAARPELPWLLGLGWYLFVREAEAEGRRRTARFRGGLGLGGALLDELA